MQALRANPVVQSLCPESAVPATVIHSRPRLQMDHTPTEMVVKITENELDEFLRDATTPIKGLARLLLNCTFSNNDVTSGITWYELYLLSIGFSDNPHCLENSSAVSSKPIKYPLREFAKQAVALVKYMLCVDGQLHFRASNRAPNRMRNYGFSNCPQHLRLAPLLHAGVLDLLNVAVLQINRPLSIAQKTALQNTTLTISTYDFK
eukprot:2474841-Karenia_brevis.AAC.1